MKQFFSYSLLVIALVLGFASVSATAWEKNMTRLENEVVNNEDNSASTEKDYFFDMQNSSYICNALTREFSGTRPTVTAAEQGLRDNSRNLYASQLAEQKLYTTKSLYVSFYAERQLRGYYIYALRKLLI